MDTFSLYSPIYSPSSWIIHQGEFGSILNPIADAWTIYSSRRWKENIQPIDNALDKVMKLRGVSFDWKEKGTQGIGMITEEVGKVISEVVSFEEGNEENGRRLNK